MGYIFSKSGGCFLVTLNGDIVHSSSNPIQFKIEDNKISVIISNLGGNGNALTIDSYSLSDIQLIGGIAPANTISGVIVQLNALLSSASEISVNGSPISNANPLPVTAIGGGGGSSVDRELVVTTYSVKSAFTGASIGDVITSTQVIDVSGTPSTITVLWRNQSTGLDLGSTPSSANLMLIGDTSQSITPSHIEMLSSSTQTLAANTYKSISLIVMSGSININIDGVLINNYPTNYTETWGNGIGFINKSITVTTNASTRAIINLTN